MYLRRWIEQTFFGTCVKYYEYQRCKNQHYITQLQMGQNSLHLQSPITQSGQVSRRQMSSLADSFITILGGKLMVTY